MRKYVSLAVALVAVGVPFASACGSSGSGTDGATGQGSGGDAGASATDGGPGSTPSGDSGSGAASGDAGTGGDAGASPSGPPASSLPVSYTRPDVGTPLTTAELDAATDQLIALLQGTSYFDVVESRIHGWPESDPAHGYWYGTWWSGVSVVKSGGKVSYVHGSSGADNNGFRTAPYLEGACYAHLMWGAPRTAHLAQTIERGYSSWHLAVERSATPDGLLARSSYPASVQSNDNARSVFIDYSADRPGVDGNTLFVHIPTNPTFGDVYLQNRRSKDDMGAIFRSMVQADACTPRLSAAAKADVAQMKGFYAAYSKRVEADGWQIATIDQSLNVVMPPLGDTMSTYTTSGNVECPGVLMMRLAGDGSPGSFDCGNGISSLESLTRGSLKSDALQILRTHHEAAVNWALALGQTGPALPLLQGLATRVETDLADATKPTPPSNVNPMDIVTLVLHAANTGVPLTSAEVRFVHSHLADAYASYLAPAASPTYHVFDAATPDGTYAYDPGGAGMFFSDLGLLIGSCASPLRNPAGRPLLDCSRLLAAAIK